MGERFRDSEWDRDGVISGIVGSASIPRFSRVRQLFEDDTLSDVPASVSAEFSKPAISGSIRPGMKVAVTAGSRGIANLPVIVREVVSGVKRLGGIPFVFPAMGSHGGATAEGQRAMLEGLGVTEDFIGCPIRSSMETVVIGRVDDGREVHLDKHASEADGIVLIGRVKPHTCFHGPHESGLLKMMAIGVAKQQGAETCHARGFGEMSDNVLKFGSVCLEKANILFGLALVENAFDDTCIVEAVPRADIIRRDRELLAEARTRMPQILIPEFDILVIDQIGKNFSGDGADPNVSGSYCTPYACGGPKYERYVILDLSDETHGNASGLGMADITTKRAFDKIDFDASYPNSLTSRMLNVVRVPMVLKSDELAIRTAVFSCVAADKDRPRIVRIRNTSHIDEIWISEALIPEAKAHPRLEILSGPEPLPFGADGNLPIG